MLKFLYFLLFLGLKVDDLLDEDIPEVAEAVSRLEDDVRYERIFRIKRAMDLSLKHNILAKEEWTKPEEVSYYARNFYCLYFHNLRLTVSFISPFVLLPSLACLGFPFTE